ncbi:MAG TPA: hypothetical protein VFD49_24330 [Candidatus Dormibacteraeota bacterium]|nr:hypothetical protein [Candidatus Dormibacteraeota bacterium]
MPEEFVQQAMASAGAGAAYRVRCERRGGGWLLWIGGPGLAEEYVTQARTYEDVDDAARAALAGLVGAPIDSFELSIEVVLAPELQEPVVLARRLRRKAAAAQRQSVAALERAARMLTAAGYTRRDAAALLGVSRQRISQLLGE